MTPKEALLHYYPYWILGIAMMIATLFSEHKDLMRIQKKSLFEFAKRMVVITVYRCLFFLIFPPTLASSAAVLKIPLWLTFTVGWEDMVHTLPLIIAARFMGNSKPAKVVQYLLTGLVMTSFLLGHLYQGVFAACLISFYVPIVSQLGKKHGFGTVAICHVAYDFLTLLTVRLFLGL